MEEAKNKICPISRIAKIVSHLKNNPTEMQYEEECFKNCAWFVEDKCVLLVMAEKLNSAVE